MMNITSHFITQVSLSNLSMRFQRSPVPEGKDVARQRVWQKMASGTRRAVPITQIPDSTIAEKSLLDGNRATARIGPVLIRLSLLVGTTIGVFGYFPSALAYPLATEFVSKRAAVRAPSNRVTKAPGGCSENVTSIGAATKAGDFKSDADGSTNAVIDRTLGNHAIYQVVIRHFQSAVAAGDSAGVSKLVEYPIRVGIAGKSIVINDEKTFIDRYEQFMTPEIMSAIVNTRYRDLFVNYQGVMFGKGQAWINGICKDKQCKELAVKVVVIQPVPN